MEYRVLTIGLTDELFSGIQAVLASNNLRLTPSLTVRDAGHILSQQRVHLLIADLEYLRRIGQDNWLTGIRRITFVPVIVLSDNPEKDTSSMVELGADICVSGKGSCSMIANLAFAQMRRYTKYNHYHSAGHVKGTAFQIGDIFIDPARRVVEACGQPIVLRPREFSLLLYFMQNPDIVLTANQICEHAWGMDYTQSVGQSVHELRKQIMAKTGQLCYIQTVYRVGYRFMAHYGKTCDN